MQYAFLIRPLPYTHRINGYNSTFLIIFFACLSLISILRELNMSPFFFIVRIQVILYILFVLIEYIG